MPDYRSAAKPALLLFMTFHSGTKSYYTIINNIQSIFGYILKRSNLIFLLFTLSQNLYSSNLGEPKFIYRAGPNPLIIHADSTKEFYDYFINNSDDTMIVYTMRFPVWKGDLYSANTFLSGVNSILIDEDERFIQPEMPSTDPFWLPDEEEVYSGSGIYPLSATRPLEQIPFEMLKNENKIMEIDTAFKQRLEGERTADNSGNRNLFKPDTLARLNSDTIFMLPDSANSEMNLLVKIPPHDTAVCENYVLEWYPNLRNGRYKLKLFYKITDIMKLEIGPDNWEKVKPRMPAGIYWTEIDVIVK